MLEDLRKHGEETFLAHQRMVIAAERAFDGFPDSDQRDASVPHNYAVRTHLHSLRSTLIDMAKRLKQHAPTLGYLHTFLTTNHLYGEYHLPDDEWFENPLVPTEPNRQPFELFFKPPTYPDVPWMEVWRIMLACAAEETRRRGRDRDTARNVTATTRRLFPPSADGTARELPDDVQRHVFAMARDPAAGPRPVLPQDHEWFFGGTTAGEK